MHASGFLSLDLCLICIWYPVELYLSIKMWTNCEAGEEEEKGLPNRCEEPISRSCWGFMYEEGESINS